MLRSFLQKYIQLIQDLSKSQMDSYMSDKSKKTLDTDAVVELEPDLQDSCAKFVIHFREDGEFTIATDFIRNDQKTVEISGLLLHMLNSGDLAEYFVESLKVWARGDIEKESFAKEVIKEWKKSFYENSEQDLPLEKNKLAIDPSDVFGLKRIQ